MFSKMFKEDTRKAAATSKPHGERNTPKPSPERREPGKPTSRNRLGAGRAAAAGAALLAVPAGVGGFHFGVATFSVDVLLTHGGLDG